MREQAAKRLMITGGAGFIGSALVRSLLRSTPHELVVVDKLTYAGNLDSLTAVANHHRYRFVRADIVDAPRIQELVQTCRPDIIMHLAAESHVDRSIDSAGEFIQTNVVGTFTLLEAALAYWRRLTSPARERFRFHHISTDEVFGSLGPHCLVSETAPYRPSSPYAASKAASDHLVRAWHETFGLPVLISNSSNTYGPCQFPEKLIPLMIVNCLLERPLPVYGRGENVRDWLYVEDHARALMLVALQGRPGESYNIAGNCERRNIEVVQAICALMDQLAPSRRIGSHEALITFVSDRPGHDIRYGLDTTKVRRTLGWEPRETFETGLAKTVRWYLDNRTWWERIRSGVYRGERLGLAS